MRLWRGRNARFAADYHLNSGVGSDLEATQAIVSSLPNVFESLSVRSVLDIPCGDFVYMRQINLGSITYIGADVIEELILSHQRLHESAQKHFRVLDIVTSDLPDVDLVLCRDCLVHFSDRLIKKAVNNIKRSRSRYLLTTTFPEHTTNKAIVTGSWRPLNLCAPPFDFPPPIRLINDGYTAPFEDKSLGLWHVHDLPAY
jgi:SAM-dependent methyltransferase